jgi:hypothetical protein
MPYEPSWSKDISNSTVCTWFYALALINLFFGAAGILSGIYLMSKGRTDIGGVSIIALSSFVAFINTWFLFLVCNRGLKN